MIRWCSYCQKFMGESEPYSNFNWTDGICPECKTAGKINSKEFSDDFKKKHEFFLDLRGRALAGEPINVADVLAQSKLVGAKVSDVLMGILQPILCELGDLYALEKISTVEEHHFTTITEQILSHFEIDLAHTIQNQKTRVIFACADQNYHTIGIRMLGLLLQSKGINSRCISPGLPVGDLVKLCGEVQPDVLGISLFSEDHIAYVQQVLALLASNRPKLVAVGGNYAKENIVNLDPEIYISNSRSIEDALEKIISVCKSGSEKTKSA